MTDLGTLGGHRSAPLDINEAGQVVGLSRTLSGEQHAFVWDSTHGMRDLGTLGGDFSSAFEINEAGQVVGGSRTSSGEYHAFITTVSPGRSSVSNACGALDNAESSGQGNKEGIPIAKDNNGCR